jgi:hypothetical protein
MLSCIEVLCYIVLYYVVYVNDLRQSNSSAVSSNSCLNVSMIQVSICDEGRQMPSTIPTPEK